MNVKYIVSKVGQAVLTLLLASVVVFLGVRALPGDPALTLAGENPSPELIAAINEKYGFDQPLLVQYGRFFWNAVRGDLGRSSRSGLPISDMIGQTLPVTIQLAVFAVALAAVVGILFGVAAAYWKGRWPEWLANGLAIVGLSVPSFWLGMLAILYFSVSLGWLPASGYVSPFTDPAGTLSHLIMPAFVLSTGLAAVVMRQTRSGMLEAFSTEYIVAARAKGLTEWKVVIKHALRNSMIVVTTIIGLQLGALIGGVVITERLFGLPGFGKLTVDSIAQRDYAVIQAVVLVVAASYVVINLLVDVLYSLIDPRVRVGGS
jgi:peptide/nickel transport system permease protein